MAASNYAHIAGPLFLFFLACENYTKVIKYCDTATGGAFQGEMKNIYAK